ncbi:MAG: branched-chain amino acid ABC transporter permease [Labrys sp. (in: a-proteobacteria)]
MELITPVIIAGLTTGALYALATLGLSLVWGALGMLNMAHGAMLTLGGYAAFAAVTQAGLPLPFGILAAIFVGAIAGAIIYGAVTKPLLNRAPEGFETTIMIATFGVAIALENAILMVFGGQPFGQPVTISGNLGQGGFTLPKQNLLIMLTALVLMAGVALYLKHSRGGRAIRAVAQNREAAELLGVSSSGVYLKVLVISGALAGVCGLLVSSITQLSPTLGADPMLKAFIMCVVAGLGNIPGGIIASFGLALIEAFVQYGFGARWGFPTLLAIVILVLILRPAGLFGQTLVRRL